MIIRGSGRRSVRSLDPAEIVWDVRCRERRDGLGEVMISTNFRVRTKNTLVRRTSDRGESPPVDPQRSQQVQEPVNRSPMPRKAIRGVIVSGIAAIAARRASGT